MTERKTASRMLEGHFEYLVFSTPGQPFVVDISSLRPTALSDVRVVVGGLRKKGPTRTPLSVNWEIDGKSSLALKLWAYDPSGKPPSMSDNEWAGAAIEIDYKIIAS